MTPFVVSIVGLHDVGKTKLISRVIPALADRGYRVGTVKHAPHLSVMDPSGTRPDTARHLQAGALRTLLAAEDGMVLQWPATADMYVSSVIARQFADVDIVLVEGLKHGPFPKIEVFRRTSEVAAEPLAGQIDVLAVITDERVALHDGVPRFSPQQTERIADFIADLACQYWDAA